MKKIYHYTSVETLKLILLNRTLRFKSLGLVDDVKEERTANFGNAGRMTYVSCWTTLDENRPQWNGYGDNYKGVMIGIEFEKIEDVFLSVPMRFGDKVVPTLPVFVPPLDIDIPGSEFFSFGKVMPTGDRMPMFFDIEYTDDERKLNPYIVSSNGTGLSIDFSEMGKCKSSDWSFQKECRFAITCLPWSYKEMEDFMASTRGDFGEAIFNKLRNVSTELEHIDLLLNFNIFNNFTVVFGPRCFNDEKEEIKKIANLLNFNISFKDSSLEIR